MKIDPMEKSEVAEPARAAYETLEQRSGRVVNFFKMMAHKPLALGPFLEFYTQVWAPGALSPRIKELAYLRTSLMNGCEY